jgi:hypothetical protein
MKVFHHYTSEEGHSGILQSKMIRPSLRANNPRDARFGDGQYLSDILPGPKRPGQLSMIFFGMPFGGRRFTHYVSSSNDGTRLAIVALPPLSEISRQIEFEAKSISAEEFEAVWKRATT